MGLQISSSSPHLHTCCWGCLHVHRRPTHAPPTPHPRPTHAPPGPAAYAAASDRAGGAGYADGFGHRVGVALQAYARRAHRGLGRDVHAARNLPPRGARRAPALFLAMSLPLALALALTLVLALVLVLPLTLVLAPSWCQPCLCPLLVLALPLSGRPPLTLPVVHPRFLSKPGEPVVQFLPGVLRHVRVRGVCRRLLDAPGKAGARRPSDRQVEGLRKWF